jgi:tetratricopeptide (TPR) repeat protein/tRNA A-37 threonylcarbamoyl transferase component Bud32
MNMTSQQEFFHASDEQLDLVIAHYLRAEANGQAGDPRAWIDRYPNCAAGLAEFFDNRLRINELVQPVRLNSPINLGIDPAAIDHDRSLLSAEMDTVDFDAQPPRLPSGRYRPLRFHARGGMGEIWLAEDSQIGRQVAVKKLRTGRDKQQARFMIEAQITGQLEHPSVVPLHDLGVDETGQPFYVMKFVQGRRLTEYIAEFHASPTSADWLDNIAFRRLLEIFVHVCNVVAYAHSRSVLHRDIKPDNIMLGPYGEVVVLDWGLAKVVGQTEDSRVHSVRLSGEGSTATQDGSIVGSPFYMSPEGAEGHPEAVDQSSDVYLLGATLYQILTDQPPRKGGSNWELIDLALHGRPANPRKLNPGIPRAIEAICRKAMAYRKQDRYATPLELADDVQRFLAAQPTVAYREPWLTRIGRWLRRHRRVLLRSVTLAGMLCLACSAWYSFRQVQRLAARETARAQLQEFHRLADEAQFFAANTDAINERFPYYDAVRAQVDTKKALALTAPWGEQSEYLPIEEARADLLGSKYSLLLLLAQLQLDKSPSASSGRSVLATLDQAKPLQPLSKRYHQLRSAGLNYVGDVAHAHEELAAANDQRTPETAQDHFLQGEAFRAEDAGSAAKFVVTDNAESNHPSLARAIDEYRAALNIDPQHYWARYQLARCLLATGNASEAIEAFSACIALRPDSPWSYATRGLAYAFNGNTKDALIDVNRAVSLDKDFLPARLNKGIAEGLNNETDAALRDFDAVLTATTDKNLVEAAFCRGQLLLAKHRDKEALNDFSTTIKASPYCALAYWYRAIANFNLGDFAAGLADVDDFVKLEHPEFKLENPSTAVIAVGKAVRKIAQQCEGDVRSHLLSISADQLRQGIAAGAATAENYGLLGAVCELQHMPLQAMEAYDHGLKLAPEDVTLLNLRGWLHVNNKQYGLARADFSAALRQSPENPESHAGFGFVLAKIGDDGAARMEASTALLTGQNSHLVLHNVGCIYGVLSGADKDRQPEDENLSLAALARAIEISRQYHDTVDADEAMLIRQEDSFPAALRARPEFQRLLTDKRRGMPN